MFREAHSLFCHYKTSNVLDDANRLFSLSRNKKKKQIENHPVEKAKK